MPTGITAAFPLPVGLHAWPRLCVDYASLHGCILVLVTLLGSLRAPRRAVQSCDTCMVHHPRSSGTRNRPDARYSAQRLSFVGHHTILRYRNIDWNSRGTHPSPQQRRPGDRYWKQAARLKYVQAELYSWMCSKTKSQLHRHLFQLSYEYLSRYAVSEGRGIDNGLFSYSKLP